MNLYSILYLCVLLAIYITICHATITPLYYHLVTNDRCEIAVGLGNTLDLVCQSFPAEQHCLHTSIAWKKLGSPKNYNISDSNKYGIWETIPVVCGATMTECASKFWNGVCDVECDNEENLFDGFDCAPKLKSCPAHINQHCDAAYANHHCDSECDNIACGWDGGDCQSLLHKQEDFKNIIVLVLKHGTDISESEHSYIKKTFSQLLGSETMLHIIPGHLLFQEPETVVTVSAEYMKYSNNYNIKLYLQIDNSRCQSKCFKNANYAAHFLETAMENGWDPGIPVVKVGVLDMVSNVCPLENNTLLGIPESVDHQASVKPAGQPRTQAQPVPWLVIGFSVGMAMFFLVIAVAVLVKCQHMRYHRKHQVCSVEADIHHIRAAKHSSSGTEV